MRVEGIIIGLIAFIIIGVFHPIVIKTEYYFGKKAWPIFFIVGITSLVISTFLSNFLIASAIGVFGFSSLWSIHEIIEQEERVKKGWFPQNPNRKKKS
ncbi:MAG: DUF4491 family protein [Velocimicrobium sp.]